MTVGTQGRHIILDCWGVNPSLLGDKLQISQILVRAANASGARILYDHFHHFGAEFGVTGVLVLAESHISIHTWPEEQYAAIDIFMCGHCNPEAAIRTIERELLPFKTNVLKLERGNDIIKNY